MTKKILTIEEIKEKITPLLIKHGVVRSAIFGSVARGEATASSDIDVLVETKKPVGYFSLIRMKLDLENILRKRVDLLTYGAVNRRLNKYIKKDQVEIYAQKSR
jgi:predicted nucleotidyltransferase